jgi:hypothetical protein
MQLLALTLRYLATRYLANPDLDRTDPFQSNQNTARTNAAEASATMRRRRHERDEVDAYLRSRSHGHHAVKAATGHAGHESRRAL